MSEPGTNPELLHENIECSFEAGLNQIMSKIKLLLTKQDYVVVAIAGPESNDTNVGKTTLGNKLAEECLLHNIPHLVVSDAEQLLNPSNQLLLNTRQQDSNSNKGVVILSAVSSPAGEKNLEKIQRFKNHKDREVQSSAREIGLPLDKIDIRVFIYRADRPITPNERAYADVVIKNEQAINKIK